ncbi:hypothetical protein LguiA_019385 [Lonicera macranthoides]
MYHHSSSYTDAIFLKSFPFSYSLVFSFSPSTRIGRWIEINNWPHNKKKVKKYPINTSRPLKLRVNCFLLDVPN